jgi:very-short-patch-repair endonuclease
MGDKLIPLAKSLRRRTTDTEQVLWRHLKAKRFGGLKFRRQQPIGKYIVDFVCFEKKIIVELDGGQHALQSETQNDNRRDHWFEAQGYKVLRFWDNEVLVNTPAVLEVIWENCLDHTLPSIPSHQGRGSKQEISFRSRERK